jgi:hypothetical protein
MLRCWHAFIGKLSREMRNLLDRLAKGGAQPVRRLKVETVMVREHQGTLHEVMMVPGGFCWQQKTYPSLSTIAMHRKTPNSFILGAPVRSPGAPSHYAPWPPV